MPISCKIPLAMVVLLLVSAVAAAQPPVPIGDVFPVNTTTTQDQSIPEVATDLDGFLVAVWTSDGQDGSGLGVFAQLFEEAGEPFGPEFQVNDTTAGDQTDPSVSMSDEESFAVAWVGPDADGTGIFLRVFEEKGATTKTDVAVNSVTTGNQSNPDVAFAEDGQILVVWQSPDDDGEGVVGRFFDVDGLPLSAEFAIATSTTGDQTVPVAADVDEDGSFVVAWEGVDADGRGIFGQQVEDTGSLIGSELAVNTTTLGDQTLPGIAVRTNDDELEDNGFVITWQGPDGDLLGIFAQFFDEDGNPTGSEIVVNVDTVGDQFDPDVSIDDEGAYVVTWADSSPPPAPVLGRGGDGVQLEGSPILIRGRRFSPPENLRDLGPEGEDVFTISSGSIERPAVALEANGDFAVLWQDANDGSGTGVFGQRYSVASPIFIDGFEDGDTSAWSATFP